MKKIGFLSFGHWSPSPQSATRSAQDVLWRRTKAGLHLDDDSRRLVAAWMGR